MLKTVIFFLLGCSFYFGQSNGTLVTREVALEGDGTKVTSTSGEGSGTQGTGTSTQQQQQQQLINEINELKLYSDQGNLNMFLSQQDKKFNRYGVYDISGNLKKEQIISPVNSYTVDISNLSSGNYLIVVSEYPSNTKMSRLFVKP